MAAKYRDTSRAAYLLKPNTAPWTARYRALPFAERGTRAFWSFAT